MALKPKYFAEPIRRGFDYTHRMKEAGQELAGRKDELRDLLRVPTIASLSGLALVLHGSRRIDTLRGVHEVAAGRSFDLVDGFLARALSQESTMGAKADAVCDKLGMTAILSRAWQKDVVPKPVIAVVMASNIANAALTATAVIRHPGQQYETPESGKHSMALFNAGVFSYAYASALEREYPYRNVHRPLRYLGAAAIGIGAVIAGRAVAEYAQRAVGTLE